MNDIQSRRTSEHSAAKPQPVTVSDPNTTSTETAASEQKHFGGALWEIVKFFLLAIFIVLPIRAFVAQPFIVDGRSMDPTFHTGQYLIIDEISYRFSEPQRGDVVVLRYPHDTSKFFIKRIIGMPGERVVVDGDTVRIYRPNSPLPVELNEPYVIYHVEDGRRFNYSEIELADDEYFVMGDNRAASSDSRDWGPVPRRLIIGRALLRLFPPTEAALNPGKTEYLLTEK